MKTKIGVLVISSLFAGAMVAGPAQAFHDGGVAYCEGCHTMHNSVDGQINANGGTVGTGVSTWLTKGSDPSSTCLNCHQGTAGSYHISTTDGGAYTPGGDFYWVNKTFSWVSRGNTITSEGEDHGHNIIADDFGFVQDATLTTAPGGTYPASYLGCNSCHDPHGQKRGVSGLGTKGGAAAIQTSGSYGPANPAVAGAFRILGETGYDGGEGAGVSFTDNAPIAKAPSFSSIAETNSNHVDYGSGMSEWCANCHVGFTADSSNPMRHPASDDAHLGTDLSNNYNAYVASGNFTGLAATSYLALVPFERGVTDATTLSTTSTAGPDAASNVMCLSCHRAHASAFGNATRWDVTTTFLSGSHPKAGDTGVSGNDVLNSYYGRDMTATFGAYQRSLCNKCHVQD